MVALYYELRVQEFKSETFFLKRLLAGWALAALSLGLSCAQATHAAEQIAQAIPAPPPVTGLYSPAPVSGALGQAMDEASAASSRESSANSSASGSVSLDTSAPDDDSRKIAQAAQGATATTGDTPAIDLAPVKLLERSSPTFQPSQFQTGLLYKLPAKFFFYSSTENSLRYESNVFQTLHNNRGDMIYRVLPNVTMGYALTSRTRVSANYFFLRDQYTRDNHTLSRNFNSIGLQIQHDVPINERTTLTAGFMGRQLLISRGQPLSDLLPSVQLTRRVGMRGVVYGGVLGQIRFRNTLGLFQEGDQFYSLGGMYRTARWLFLWDNTFITNFGNRRLRFGPNNQNMIMTLEADYRVHPKLPLVAFVRAQPIFNIGADEATGVAGFNFRIFGGLRIDLNKAPVFPVKVDQKKK